MNAVAWEFASSPDAASCAESGAEQKVPRAQALSHAMNALKRSA
jgi:hypothetical protein